MVADPQLKKRVAEKRLIFTGQKISLLALHTASLELDHILVVLRTDFFQIAIVHFLVLAEKTT